MLCNRADLENFICLRGLEALCEMIIGSYNLKQFYFMWRINLSIISNPSAWNKNQALKYQLSITYYMTGAISSNLHALLNYIPPKLYEDTEG